jgi:hypothetical protein
MANTITKLTANGNYYLSGGLDEVSGTYSTNGLICHWPTYSPSFVAGSQWIDIVNGNNLYIPTSNIYNPGYSTIYSNAVYATNNLFFGTGSTAYNVNIPQLAGATSCTIEGVIKIQSFSTSIMVLAFDHYDIFINGGNLGYNTGNSDNYGITSTQITNLGLAGKYVHYVFVFTTFPSGTGTYANNQIWINGVQQTLTQNQSLCATSGRGFNNYNGGSLPGSQFPINYCFTINTWPTQFASYSGGNNGFGGLRMYNRTLTPAEIIQNYNVAASNPAFGLTPISAPPQSSLTINSTTQNTATFLVNNYDEYTKGGNLVTNGLIYYMDPAKLESWNGNTTIYDITKTQPPGTIVNNPTVTNPNSSYFYNTSGGGSITMNESAYANTNITANVATFQPFSNFTMSIWCKFINDPYYFDSGGAIGGIFDCAYFQGFGIEWAADTSGKLLGTPNGGVFPFMRTNAEYVFIGQLNLVKNQWYNFVYVNNYSATLQQFYTNGNYVNYTGTSTVNYYNSNLPSSILIGSGGAIEGGGASFNDRQNFPGLIGQALIYNRALSAAEVLQNYNEMLPQYII